MGGITGATRIHDDFLVRGGLEGRGEEELHALVEEDVLAVTAPDSQRRIGGRLEEDEERLARRGEAHGRRERGRRAPAHVAERVGGLRHDVLG